jgi:hypothetical protein
MSCPLGRRNGSCNALANQKRTKLIHNLSTRWKGLQPQRKGCPH